MKNEQIMKEKQMTTIGNLFDEIVLSFFVHSVKFF